jgi:hypothetical protein
MDIPEDFDLARHQAVTQYLRQHGPTSLEWLAQHVRRTCRDARIYRTERWWSGHDDIESRPAELTRAIGHAVLEVPELFATPQRPLNELLYDALQQDRVDHHWREFPAAHQGGSVSFCITDMPIALDSELGRRAQQYGMSKDQLMIAMLGHLACAHRSRKTWSRGTRGSRSICRTLPTAVARCACSAAAMSRTIGSRRMAEPSPVRSAVGRPHLRTQPPTVGYRVSVFAGPRPHLRGGRLA